MQQQLFGNSATDIDTTINTTASPSIASVRVKTESQSINELCGRNAREPEKQYQFSSSVEDYSSLPSLQDLLEDFEDFDASRLEELAESLLDGVTSEFEDDATKSSHRTTKIEGKPKPMLRSMVGPETENLESRQNTNGSIKIQNNYSTIVNTIKKEIDCSTSDDDMYVSTAPIAPSNQMQLMQTNFDHTKFNHSEQMFEMDNSNSSSSNCSNNASTNITATNTDKSMTFRSCCGKKDNRTLYETTYNDDRNIITVILPDEDISNFEEVIEEVSVNGDDDECMSHVSALSPIPSAYYASPKSLNSSDDLAVVSDHDSAYDSGISSPPGKLSSAWSTTSSVNYLDDDYQCGGDYWSQDSFSVLFPSLA